VAKFSGFESLGGHINGGGQEEEDEAEMREKEGVGKGQRS